jgi:hypothetical protein
VVSLGNPWATQGQPPGTVSQGFPKVADRLPTENPRGTKEVAQVAQVAHKYNGNCPECGNVFASGDKCINDKCRFWTWEKATIADFIEKEASA